MDSELQGMREAEVRQNGEGVKHRVERNHVVEAHRGIGLRGASSSSATERKNGLYRARGGEI